VKFPIRSFGRFKTHSAQPTKGHRAILQTNRDIPIGESIGEFKVNPQNNTSEISIQKPGPPVKLSNLAPPNLELIPAPQLAKPPKFERLPPEIQIKIWSLVLPRIFIITDIIFEKYDEDGYNEPKIVRRRPFKGLDLRDPSSRW